MYPARRGSNNVQRSFNRCCHLRLKPHTTCNPSSSAYSTQKATVQNIPQTFQDPVLTWARSIPELAQKCLEPPVWDDWKHCDATFDREKTLSLEGYLKWRRWTAVPNENEIDSYGDNFASNATALISHVLSAPLTLASQLGRFQPMGKQDIELQRWCSVGARAEATLPPIYWKELLLLRNKESCHDVNKVSSCPDILLEFMGPDIPPNSPDATVTLGSVGSLSIRGGFRGLYHEYPQPSAHSSPWDAFVFFNPGFAHPNLQKSWEPTLQKILQEQETSPVRMLLTAHSEKDADRDSKLLWEKFGLRVQYNENPFASRIRYQDPFDPNHYVQPNHFVALVDFDNEDTSSDAKKTTRHTFESQNRMNILRKVSQKRFAINQIYPQDQQLLRYGTIRPFSTATSTSDNAYLKFNASSLGLEYSLIRPVLSSIRQLPEVDSVWDNKDNFASESTLNDLGRATQIFAAFQKGGREHLAVQSMIAECQQRMGLYNEALQTLEEIQSTVLTETLPPHFQHDMVLAQAKVHWTNGDFQESQKLCETIIATYDDLEEKFPTTNLHLASAMMGKALSQLAFMNSLQDAYSVRDFFRIATKFLERHPPTHNTLPQAAVLLNGGMAEALYNLFLEKTNNVSVPMDSALRAWFQGLQKADVSKHSNPQVMAASQFLQANFQSNLAWGVLNYEQDRSDRLSKASDFAKKALLVYDDPNAAIGKEGLPHVLSVVACCYFQADSAVTAEGLFQSAIDRKGRVSNGTLTLLQLKDAYLQYSELCKNWEKREGDAKRLVGESETIDASLPQSWQGKSGLYGNLWFWTPGEMQ